MNEMNGTYIGTRTDTEETAVFIPEEITEIETLRKKLKENREESDRVVAQAREKEAAMRTKYEAKMAEMDRERQARVREIASRKARTVAIVKRSLASALLVGIFFLLWWLDQCKIAVPLVVTALTLIHLAYYAGTWRLEVFQ